MLYPRYNAHYKEKKCPICQRYKGELYAQPGPLKALGYFGHYAHIQCVVDERLRQTEKPIEPSESCDRPAVDPADQPVDQPRLRPEA